jgi:type VI secretion system secreted protein Hcp
MRLFLKLDGVKGDSVHVKHQDEIDVESFSFGVFAPGGPGASTGTGSGRPEFPDFSFTTASSIASPVLFLSCAQGKHLKEAFLTARNEGSSGVEFYKVRFADVVISSYSQSGVEALPRPQDAVAFRFAKIHIEFSNQGPDGKLNPPVVADWDLKGMKGLKAQKD